MIWRASTPALASGAGLATAMPRMAGRRARVNFILMRFFDLVGMGFELDVGSRIAECDVIVLGVRTELIGSENED
jgi:hypothetical protein